MKANLGIKKESQQAVAQALSKILADEFLLSTKTKNAHWNIEGVGFYSLHQLFENQFRQMDENIDEIAERIRTLGSYTPATLKDFLKISQFTEALDRKNDATGFIEELLLDQESMVMSLRGNIIKFESEYNDVVSTDFLIKLIGGHEKMAWFLRSNL